MDNCLNKYFAGELTFDERKDFLMEINNDDKLKEEFIEYQNMLALIDWISIEYGKEQSTVQYKLNEFINRMEQYKNE